jgi:hypothetical protein
MLLTSLEAPMEPNVGEWARQWQSEIGAVESTKVRPRVWSNENELTLSVLL